MKMELRKTFQFEAAHLLPRLPKYAQMPAAARAQLQGGNRRGGRMRREARLAHGLRRHYGGVQADMGKIGPSLLERSSRPEKSDQRSNRGLDLEKTEITIATAHGSGRGRDLHGAVRLSGVAPASRGFNSASRRIAAVCARPVWTVRKSVSSVSKGFGRDARNNPRDAGATDRITANKPGLCL